MGQLLTKLLGGGGGRQTTAITTPRFGDDENEFDFGEEELCAPLWVLVRRYPDVWGEVLKHLNTTDIKFLYDVNRESRFVIRRQGYVVRDTKFRISEFSSVSTLEFAWENIPRKSDLVHRVAGSGQVTLLRWLIEEKKATFDERATFHAATYKRYDALKFLVENGAPMTKDVSRVCSSNGAEDCLRFALDNGVESDFICSSNAAENGHLHILKFLHEEKGVPINADTAYSAAKNGHTHCLKYLIEDKNCPVNEWACTWAAKQGHLECLRYLHEHGAPWDEFTCHSASGNGHGECLKYAFENGCVMNEFTINYACERNHIETLRFARDNGCPWDSYAAADAAAHGNIECLKYCLENGCPTDVNTTRRAAGSGHLDCLKLLREFGAPMDERAVARAAKGGYLDCVKFLHESGCPHNMDACNRAAEYGHLDVLKYLRPKSPFRVLERVGVPRRVSERTFGGFEIPPLSRRSLGELRALSHRVRLKRKTSTDASIGSKENEIKRTL